MTTDGTKTTYPSHYKDRRIHSHKKGPSRYMLYRCSGTNIKLTSDAISLYGTRRRNHNQQLKLQHYKSQLARWVIFLKNKPHLDRVIIRMTPWCPRDLWYFEILKFLLNSKIQNGFKSRQSFSAEASSSLRLPLFSHFLETDY
jgi:hypothetical protein